MPSPAASTPGCRARHALNHRNRRARVLPRRGRATGASPPLSRRAGGQRRQVDDHAPYPLDPAGHGFRTCRPRPAVHLLIDSAAGAALPAPTPTAGRRAPPARPPRRTSSRAATLARRSPARASTDLNVRRCGLPCVPEQPRASAYASASYGHIVFSVARRRRARPPLCGDQPGRARGAHTPARRWPTASCVFVRHVHRGHARHATRTSEWCWRATWVLNNSSTSLRRSTDPQARPGLRRATGAATCRCAPRVSPWTFPAPARWRCSPTTTGRWSTTTSWPAARAKAWASTTMLEFEFGSPIHMNWLASGVVLGRPAGGRRQCHRRAERDGLCRLLQQLLLDGISAVTDANGNLVNGFTAKNGVGVDYAQSFANAALVPEPGMWALMAAGLVVLGLAARRHHRRVMLATMLSMGVGVASAATFEGWSSATTTTGTRTDTQGTVGLPLASSTPFLTQAASRLDDTQVGLHRARRPAPGRASRTATSPSSQGQVLHHRPADSRGHTARAGPKCPWPTASSSDATPASTGRRDGCSCAMSSRAAPGRANRPPMPPDKAVAGCAAARHLGVEHLLRVTPEGVHENFPRQRTDDQRL